MTGFSIDWLDLREPADQQARDKNLLQQAGNWLATAHAPSQAAIVTDLGAGTGSTLRAFSSLAPPANSDKHSLHWRLVDLDAPLLAEASRRHGQTHWLQTFTLDLADVAALPLDGAHLVTASALFDLVSAGFIDTLISRLRQQCQHQPIGLYAALNYDGTTLWTPSHPLDAAVLSAFNQDQQRDKGFGPALGPEAGAYLERQFQRAGFRVSVASSPWELSGDDNMLVHSLITGIADAVATGPTPGSQALDSRSLQDWVQFRLAHAATGHCTVGHLDLLALPESTANAER